MAGRPLKRAMVQEFERRRDELELPDTLAYVEHWLESGQTIQALADDMAKTMGYPLSRPMVSTYVNSLPDAVARMTVARQNGAHAHAEHALQIADGVKAQPDEIAKATMQVRIRQWLAEKQNREAYGQTSKVEVTHTLNTLHLDALRARQVPPQLRGMTDAEIRELPTAPTHVIGGPLTVTPLPGTPEVHQLEPGDLPNDAA